MRKLLLVLGLALSAVSYGQTGHPKDDVVYRPTLTGLGERVHLSNPGINLSTYVTDIMNVIKFEDLHDIILVEHSYSPSGIMTNEVSRLK